MASVRGSNVEQTIDKANQMVADLREAEKVLAVIRSKKSEVLATLKKWKIDPNQIDKAIATAEAEIAELNNQLNEKLDRADKILSKIQVG